jgi:hypothetical protein
MVVNKREIGIISNIVLEEKEDSDNESTEKRGRGRPAGSLNKSNGGLGQLKDEVAALTAKVEALQAQISRQVPPVQLNVPPIHTPASSSNQYLEERVSVIQSWVENFHHFLITSRITNSVDRVAEEELALIMERLPDNVSIINAEEER